MASPLISIVTVSYNSEETIKKTIESVLSQSYGNKEYIIIDGDSKDGTVDIIKKYEDRISFWCSEPDNGIPEALNKGVRNATGEWLYFLSSDDEFVDDDVLKRVSNYLKDQKGLVYGDVILKSMGKVFDGKYDAKKIILKNICHQAQFYHKSVFEKIGDFNIQYKYLSDYDHTLKIFSNSEIEAKYIDEVIAVFNDEGRTSFSLDVNFWKDRKHNFIERFKDVLSPEYAARGFENYFYYTLQNGMILQGIYSMLQLIFYTGKFSYFMAGIRNWMSYLGRK